jgi:hypothetical protein
MAVRTFNVRVFSGELEPRGGVRKMLFIQLDQLKGPTLVVGVAAFTPGHSACVKTVFGGDLLLDFNVAVNASFGVYSRRKGRMTFRTAGNPF